jgi:CubicO group peptidase (beta-lactamase class C family)
LAARHKGKLDSFAQGIKADSHLGSAFVVDQVIYYLPMETPYGVYPYMENLRYGVWSVSKTFVAGVAMLRLAQKFGPGVYEERLLDYFDPAQNNSGHQGWNNVRFTHCLDMNTGMGSPQGYWTRKDVNSWYYAYTPKDKLKHLFTEPDLPQGPGEKFVYNDEDIWILGVAMDRYLKKRDGPDASVLKMLAEEVYGRIGVLHFVTTTTYTDDGTTPGFPHFSWGFLPTMDDLAKITDLMHRRGLQHGVPILHQGKMRDYFMEGTKKPIEGFMMGSGYQDYRDPADGDHAWVIPAPGGMGGHQVVLMPNKTTALRFAKDGSPSPEAMITASNNLKPFARFK